MTRQLISSGSPYESIIGFSRAVRVGDFITVGGTAAIGPDGETVGRGDPAAQARRCYEIIQAALEAAGASLDDVIRTRTMLKRIEDWLTVSQVRGEIFSQIRPVDTIMQVTAFVDPEWLVEIEVDALIDRDRV
jgi:enamine deaminase RidA (YjgF/YER057c/UK114 family)